MRKLIILSLLCLTANLCSAGDDDKFSLPNGFRLGYQLSNLENNSEPAADNLSWGYIGYVRKIKLIPLIHLETGLEFMIAGAKQNDSIKLELNYLVVPVEGVVKLGPLVGMAGVSGNFRLSEKFTINGEKVSRDGETKSSSFDLALNAGAGFNILFVTIEARYYWGVLEVQDSWYNRYFQAGLKFHF